MDEPYGEDHPRSEGFHDEEDVPVRAERGDDLPEHGDTDAEPACHEDRGDGPQLVPEGSGLVAGVLPKGQLQRAEEAEGEAEEGLMVAREIRGEDH